MRLRGIKRTCIVCFVWLLTGALVISPPWTSSRAAKSKAGQQGQAQRNLSVPPIPPPVSGTGQALSGEPENSSTQKPDPAQGGSTGANPPTAAAATRLSKVGSGPAQPSATAGFILNATFDSSITSNPNSAAIQAMINQAVAIYQAQFSDPFTASILFRYSTTAPNGTPLGAGSLAQSNYVFYHIPWNSYISALTADAKTANDTTANATLPANALTTNVDTSSANGRAIGLNTPGIMTSTGGVGGGTFDGIVTLNSGQPFQFTRPPTAGNFDALRSTEHEIDEVLGLGSFINSGFTDLRPQDLFSWSSAGTRNLTATGIRYFSINGGSTNIVGFNQISGGDFGDWVSPSCPQSNPYVRFPSVCAVFLSSIEGFPRAGLFERCRL